MDKLLCITGPTATGKTALGVALAKRFGGEVVSADSMQVYRGMDVGTAKPTEAEKGGVAHHMLDICDIRETYSVARYVEEADARVVDIMSRGRLPILVGGTGLYLDALISGRDFSAQDGDFSLRRSLEEKAETEGIDAVRAILRENDPESYERLHPNDLKRIIRAAEVFLSSGKTISEHNRQTAPLPPQYRAVKIGLNFESRAELYARIDRRVDLMLERGLLEEVARLLPDCGGCTAMQAIGYKEFSAYLRGETGLAEAVDTVKRESRRYAKRQLTWLRRDEAVHWINMAEPVDFDRVAEEAADIWAAEQDG